MNKNLSVVPADLFIISDSQADAYVTGYLQSLQCRHNGCTVCATCTQIAQKQSAQLYWIAPETRYTLEMLETVFKKISFTLEQDSQFFFVIEQAHLLSGACANALLKIVEEPPAGYRFIFAASTLQGVLPTLRSRCRITICTSEESAEIPKLFPYFTQSTNPNAFLKTVSSSTISEIEVLRLTEALIQHFTKLCIATNDLMIQNYSLAVVKQLQQYAAQSIMPGSTKIFLKELYLTLTTLRKTHGIS